MSTLELAIHILKILKNTLLYHPQFSWNVSSKRAQEHQSFYPVLPQLLPHFHFPIFFYSSLLSSFLSKSLSLLSLSCFKDDRSSKLGITLWNPSAISCSPNVEAKASDEPKEPSFGSQKQTYLIFEYSEKNPLFTPNSKLPQQVPLKSYLELF